MHDLMEFLDFLTWIFRVTSFIFGVLCGAVLALGGLAGWRICHRAALRRRWRQDRPMRAYDALEPQWRDYDPDIPYVTRRCICHKRLLYPGERVLIWPEVGPGGLLHVAVYCETYEELKGGQHVQDTEPADG